MNKIHDQGEDFTNSTYKKITIRIIPFLFTCYVFAFLDRINIGAAQSHMQLDLGFSDLVYSFGAGIFFLGYVMAELPSNLLLNRTGIKWTFSRIMVIWGLISSATAFITTPHGLYVIRFLLGAAEAGLYPGVIFYLTRWYPVERRAKAIAIFTCAAGIGGLIGGPLAGALITYFDGLLGVRGWQWMFIAMGLPACLLGVAAYLLLDEGPEQARWLTCQERSVVLEDLRKNAADAGDRVTGGLVDILRDYRIYAISAVWFCQICGVYAISFWLPTLIKGAGVENAFHVGCYSALPYLASWIALIVLNRHSDKTMERRWHCALAMLIGAAGLAVAAYSGGMLILSLVSLSIALAGAVSPNPLIWAIATDHIRGRGLAGSIAIINSLGLMGGLVSPMIIGWGRSLTGTTTLGLVVIAGVMAVGALVVVTLAPALHKKGDSGRTRLKPQPDSSTAN